MLERKNRDGERCSRYLHVYISLTGSEVLLLTVIGRPVAYTLVLGWSTRRNTKREIETVSLLFRVVVPRKNLGDTGHPERGQRKKKGHLEE